jgi:hypothetical protein
MARCTAAPTARSSSTTKRHPVIALSPTPGFPAREPHQGPTHPGTISRTHPGVVGAFCLTVRSRGL